jgi:hypothetical protein
MPSLLDYLNYGGSSGLPVSLTDDEMQQLQAQQNDPTQGMSALMGTTGADSTSAQTQPTDNANNASLLQSLAQAQASAPQDNSQETAQAPAGQSDTDNSTAAPTDTDTPIAQASGQPDVSVDSASDDSANSGSSTTPAATGSSSSTPTASTADSSSDTSSSPGLLGKLGHALTSDPNLGLSLMSAGLGMMGASRYGTPGWAAVGQGGLQGVQTYQTLKQTQAANALAYAKMQNQAALDQADINSKNATTAATQYGTQSKQALQAYQQKAGNGFTVQGAVAAGVNPQDAFDMYKTLHPELQSIDQGTSTALVDRNGQTVAVLPKTQIISTSPGQVNSVYTGGSNGQAGTATPIATGGLTPDQQAAVTAESNAAAQAQTKAQTMGQAVQILQDPGYQAVRLVVLPVLLKLISVKNTVTFQAIQRRSSTLR